MTDYSDSRFDRLRECRLFLFDMDGTLYLGDDVFDGAVELTESIPALGYRYMYLTNNSSRSGEDYIPRLRRLGFPCEKENVFSSGMAAGLYLSQNYPDSRVYLIGTEAFKKELLSYGVNVIEDDLTDIPSSAYDRDLTLLPKADIVVAGFDIELVYEKLNRACHHLRRGARFIAANPDFVCPIPKGEVLPDCGSICALLTAATGAVPEYIGKPNRNMIDVISKMTGVPNEKICAVGDRLYTDIAVAQNAEAVSLLVMSGETDEEMLSAAERKPDYVLSGVNELLAILKS